jgi:hypothetical protein
MKSNRIAWILIGVTAMAGFAHAATDLSTAKGAAKSFYSAVAAGDEQGIRECILAEGDQQEQLATTMVDMIVAGKKLGDAAKGKFGANTGKLAVDTVNKEDAARIDAAPETDNGDDATLQLNPNSKAMIFHKTPAGWKMRVLDYAGGKPDNIPAQITLLTALISAMNDTAADISAGKYPASPDAEASLRQRFSDVMANHYKPATNPTTAPAAK